MLVLCCGFEPSIGGTQHREQENAAAQAKAADDPVLIEGKSIEAWLAALKDRDAGVRKGAVEILGKRAVDPAIDAAERSRLQTAVRSLSLSEKDADVRKAAAFYADLFKASHSPEMVERLLKLRNRNVEPTRRAIRLVDAQDRPVAGAVVSTYFNCDADYSPAFVVPEPLESATSNSRGLLSLKLEIPSHLDGAGIYAIRPDKDRPLVGLRKVTREELDKPISVTMYPACRVRFRIASAGLPALETKYHAELTGPGWWRAAYVVLGASIEGTPRPLFASSTKGELEFLLPPGQFTIHAYGSDVKWVERPMEINPGEPEQVLGTFDLPPSQDAEKGRFPDHRRVRRIRSDGSDEVVFRRIRHLPLRGMALHTQDAAFSPDGKFLATAHDYNAAPGEVKLWDTTTGRKVAALAVADRGVVSVVFSPDGGFLAGRVRELGDAPPFTELVIWDVASRREVRRVGGSGGIRSFAFSPDGKFLCTSASDGAIRFWDPKTGREVRRIDGTGYGSLAFSRDGQTLVLSSARSALTFWDVPTGRLRPTPELDKEPFTAYSIALSPDGRTLAAGGAIAGANRRLGHGQVRLYDLAHEPFTRRAVLTFESDVPGGGGANDRVDMCSGVAFTPEGRRVVAVGMHKFRMWDVVTGEVQDAFERRGGSSSDRLVVSPDGRWCAVTSPVGNGAGIFDIVAP